jgi:hypothetical protein
MLLVCGMLIGYALYHLFYIWVVIKNGIFLDWSGYHVTEMTFLTQI